MKGDAMSDSMRKMFGALSLAGIGVGWLTILLLLLSAVNAWAGPHLIEQEHEEARRC